MQKISNRTDGREVFIRKRTTRPERWTGVEPRTEYQVCEWTLPARNAAGGSERAIHVRSTHRTRADAIEAATKGVC